jgi:O-antigen polymerase
MKKVFKHIRILIPVLLLILIILVIPQLNSSELMNPTQTGKAFGFLWEMMGYMLVMLIVATITPEIQTIKITKIDIFLGVLSLMVLVSYWLHPGDQLQILTFIALIVFYLSIRALNLKHIKYILLALIISGSIQAIYGNLQLWGYYPSNHGIFKLTGSFFNPGPYSGYLAAIFPISLGFYLFNVQFSLPKQNALLLKLIEYTNILKSYFNKISSKSHFFYNKSREQSSHEEQDKEPISTDYITMKTLALISIISMCLVLPASRSRAAWLAVLVSSAYLLAVKFSLYQQIKPHFKILARKLSMFALLITFLTISGAALYQFKKGSADGRRLIWKVSTAMIKDKPIWGHGFDGFIANYMDYQAAYFNDNPESKEAMVAGDTNYAFNEFVQLTVENGLVGLLLVLLILITIFSNKLPLKPFKQSNDQTLQPTTIATIVTTETIQMLPEVYSLTTISRSVILSIVVFGLFSYPLQILPIKICLVIALAISAGELGLKRQENSLQPIYFSKPLQFTLRYIFLVGGLGFLWLAINKLDQVKTAYIDWKSAFDTYNMGIYDDCLTDYEKAYPILKTNGDFLTNYGKALSMAETHNEAIDVLQQAAKYYPNTIVYTALGDSYKKLSQNANAEQAYIYAWHMNPSRFYPKYLLAKLYNETGQQEKARQSAKELLDKEVKIESTAVQEIKAEMKRVIGDNLLQKHDYP